MGIEVWRVSINNLKINKNFVKLVQNIFAIKRMGKALDIQVNSS